MNAHIRPTVVPRAPRRWLVLPLLVAILAITVVGSVPALGRPLATAVHLPTANGPASAGAAHAAITAARASLASGQGPAGLPVLYSGSPATPWTPAFQPNVAPSARAALAMAYDPSGPYVVAFGGGWNGGTSTNDTWVFANNSWTNISATLTTAPGPRETPMMAYDAADGYLLLFGGYTGKNPNSTGSYTLNDTWKFTAGAWTNISTFSSSAPSPRFAAAMTYDYTDGYAVLFGGNTLFGPPLNDTWTFHAGAWTNVSATAGTAPAGRDFAAMADDPFDGYALLFGGWNSTSSALYNDTWTFAGGHWGALATTVQPVPLRGESLAYDASHHQVILFGGAAAGLGGPFYPQAQTWSFAGGVWTDLTATIASPPPARYLAALTNVSANGSLLMADGCLGQGCANFLDLSDSWLFNASGPVARPWIEVGAVVQPSERATPGMVYDAADHYVLYFGGGWNGGTSTNDTWVYANHTWSNISANVTTAPAAREDPAMTYDALDGYVLLFGGYSATGGYGSPSYTQNDTWTFHAGVWTNITASSPTHPSARFASVMTYDYNDGYAVLFSGNVLFGGPIEDTWTFHAGVWTDVTATAGAPPAGRDFASMTDDPADGYVLLFGGWNSSIATVYNDTWTFAAGKWAPLTPAVSPMPIRGANVAFETVGNYVLLYGGLTYSGYGWPFGFVTETWAFKAGNWTNLTPMITTEPPPRMLGGITNISGTGEIVMADGCIYQGCPVNEDLADTWIYNWTNINGTFTSLAPVVLHQSAKFAVHVFGGDGAYSYRYSGLPGGCTSANVAVLNCVPAYGGNYTIVAQVTDRAGKMLDLRLNLTLGVMPRSLALSASVPVLDVGQSVTLSAVAGGGAGAPWTYAFTGLPPGCASANVASLSCSPTQGGSYTVTATATDAQGGPVRSVVGLVVHPPVRVAATVSAATFDLTEFVTMTAAASQGSSVYTYLWSNLPTGCQAGATTTTLQCKPATAGTFATTLQATDSLGESAVTAPIALTVNPLPGVQLAAPVVSTSDPLSATLAAQTTGGTGPYAVAWNFGDGQAGSGPSVVHIYAAGGTYTVAVSVTDARGFVASSSQSVTVQASQSNSPPPNHPTATHGATPWFATFAGMFGLGLVIGLVALAVVVVWGARRRRTLLEAEQLVTAIPLVVEGPPGAPTMGPATPSGPSPPPKV
ncbi:MAG: PKD domain-containing protein [Thermoplasmata archaeon]|nr:PKD domain-containing protein [Thermoplasmata archaeon]